MIFTLFHLPTRQQWNSQGCISTGYSVWENYAFPLLSTISDPPPCFLLSAFILRSHGIRRAALTLSIQLQNPFYGLVQYVAFKWPLTSHHARVLSHSSSFTITNSPPLCRSPTSSFSLISRVHFHCLFRYTFLPFSCPTPFPIPSSRHHRLASLPQVSVLLADIIRLHFHRVFTYLTSEAL